MTRQGCIRTLGQWDLNGVVCPEPADSPTMSEILETNLDCEAKESSVEL